MSHFKDSYESISIMECQPRVLNVAHLGHLFEIAMQHLLCDDDTLQSISCRQKTLEVRFGRSCVYPPKWCDSRLHTTCNARNHSLISVHNSVKLLNYNIIYHYVFTVAIDF